MEELLFFEEFIKKREAKKIWLQYWGVLRGSKIYLYVSRDCKDVDFCEIIWLSSDSRCILLKRRTYSFRFRLSTSDGIHYFKCDSNLQRHRWIHMIHLASSGCLPVLPPNHINMKCCLHTDSPLTNISESTKLERATTKKTCEEKDIEEAFEEKEDDVHRSDNGTSHCTDNKSTSNDNKDVAIFGQKSLKEIVSLENEKIQPCKDNLLSETINSDNDNISLNENSCAIETQEVGPPAKQTWSTNVTFGSFRKSSKKQSFSSAKERRHMDKNDSQTLRSSTEAKVDFSARFSMDNPAFIFDDSDESEEDVDTVLAELRQPSRIINVRPCMNE